MKQWCLNMMQPIQYHKHPRENVKFIAAPGLKLNVEKTAEDHRNSNEKQFFMIS